MPTIAELRGRYKPPERSVKVCLSGDLRAQHDDLLEQIKAANASGTAKMGDSSAVPALAEKLRAVEAEMQDNSAVFRFRAIGSNKLKQLEEKYPGKRGMAFDVNAGAHELLAACAVDPVISVDDALGMLEDWDRDAMIKLVNTAWEACTGSADVPFSGAAFGSILGTGSN